MRAAASGRLMPLRLDVTDGGQIAAAAETVAKSTGDAGLAGLVNNAGIVVPGPLELVPIDAWRRQLEVNVIGPVAVTQAFLPLLRKARGRVVNISSVNGGLAVPFMAPIRPRSSPWRQSPTPCAWTSHLRHPRRGGRAGADRYADLGEVAGRGRPDVAGH